MDARRVPVAEGVELAVDVWPDGDGAPVLLVHGLASNARLWDGVAGGLQSAGHPVAAVDQRGHGRSSKPSTGFDFAQVAADLTMVLDAIGWDRPVVAGQSWGGSVVLELAARHPDRVRGVVGVDGGFLDLFGRFPTWEACLAALAPPATAGLPVTAVTTMLRGRHPDWSDGAIAGALACFEVRPDNTVAPWLARDAHLEILRHLWEHRPATAAAQLRVPMLLVVADDPAEPDWTEAKRGNVGAVEDAARAATVALRVEWLRGDHDLHAQQPDRVAGLIHDFAAELA